MEPTGHDSFWDLAESGSWEPQTVAAVAAAAGPGSTIIDVGAWIGPLTLLGAALGASVVAFEPDPIARAALVANLACNAGLGQRVDVRSVALTDWTGQARLHGGRQGLGQSLTRVAPDGTVAVTCLDAAEAVAGDADGAFERATLVKVDIEGGEYRVVPRLASYLARRQPVLLLSLHSFDLRAKAERFPRRLRRPVFRLVAARRRLPLLWALRPYRVVARATAGGGWLPLGRSARWLLAFRLDEAELYCAGSPPPPS